MRVMYVIDTRARSDRSTCLLLFVAIAVTACAPEHARPCAPSACVDADAGTGAPPPTTADGPDDGPSTTPPPPEKMGSPCDNACEPGHACVEGECIADCRPTWATPCTDGTVCNDDTARCITPGDECTLPGEFVVCGTAEFPPTCGPGTECAGELCEPIDGCETMVCDSGGVCRGVRCEDAGPTGSVRGIELADFEPGIRGTPDGLSVQASVDGTDMCRMSVTFEVRVETSIFTSASNDEAVWEVDLLTGEKHHYVTGIPLVYGLTVDRTGQLYVLRGDNCDVGRIVDIGGGREFERIAYGGDWCARLTIGPDGALYVADYRDVHRIDLYTNERTHYGSIPDGLGAWQDTFITGLVFDDEGNLHVAEHWRKLLTIPPGGGMGSVYSAAPPAGMVEIDNPWNEGMAFGPDGLLYVGVFPESPRLGFIFRVNDGGATETLIDLADMMAVAPTTRWAGIHAVAFALDGAMYFTNQNTRGNTYNPFGQLFVQRTDGTLELLAEGFNFDWIYGFDGDMTVGTRVIDSVSADLDAEGRASAELDVPSTVGAYEVRVFVTDPETGRVYVDSKTARAD